MSLDASKLLDWLDGLALAGLRARGFHSRWLDAATGPVHVLEAEGSGELAPILLVHGLASCATDYLPLLMQLQPHHRHVYALDLPGHGLSPCAPENVGAEEVAESLFCALDTLLDEPVLVFGCSLGGLFALRLAIARPARVRALMLASPAGAPMTEGELDRLRARFDLRDHASALAFVGHVRARPGPGRHLLAWGVRQRMSRQAVVAILRHMRPEDMMRPDELARVRAPVTLFWGSMDRVLPPKNADYFRTHLPSVRHEEVDGFGHAPFLDRPLAFAARMEAFARAAG